MIKKKSSSWKKASQRRKKASATQHKPGRKNPSPKKRPKSAAQTQRPKRSRFTVGILTFGVALVAVALGYVLMHGHLPDTQHLPSHSGLETKAPKNHKPPYEIFPVEPNHTKTSSPPPDSETKNHPRSKALPDLPQVAIIIDDLGYDISLAKKFINLDCPLTCAILPYCRFSKEIAQLANQKGCQVMLHQPMEPNEYPEVDPGKGALLSSMTPDERTETLKQNLNAVPFIKGVNNHMGSKLTTLSDEMNDVFIVLKQRGLFFIDSRTTAATQTRSSAKMLKVPYAARDVFLDHVQTREAISAQVEELLRIAEINGKAVGIGHPHEITHAVLLQKLPEIKKQVKLVLASDILEIF